MGLDRRINQPDLELGQSEGASGNKRRLHLREVALAGAEAVEAYDGVGAALAAARMHLKLELDRVASDLRIRRTFIEAIESGRFDALPGQAYTQGFVRSYAAYLKIDPDEILERLREETSARRDSGELVFPQPVAEARLPGWQLVLATVLVAALVYVGWASSTRDNTVVDRIPPVPDQMLARPAPPAPTQAPAPSAPAAEAPPQPASPPVVAETPPQIQAPVEAPPPAAEAAAAKPALANAAPDAAPKGRVFGATDGPARIVIRANADSWVRVTEPGGAALLRRILRAGDSFNVPARSDLELAVGNAAAIDLVVDGEMLPGLGANGEVLRNIPLVPETLKQGIPKPKRQVPVKREKPAPQPATEPATDNSTPEQPQ